MVISQTVGNCLPQHGTHQAVTAALQLLEEDRFFSLPVLQKFPGRANGIESVGRASGGVADGQGHSLFQILADHRGDILTVLLRGTENQAGMCRNDFGHQSNDVIWVDLLHGAGVLSSRKTRAH